MFTTIILWWGIAGWCLALGFAGFLTYCYLKSKASHVKNAIVQVREAACFILGTPGGYWKFMDYFDKFEQRLN